MWMVLRPPKSPTTPHRTKFKHYRRALVVFWREQPTDAPNQSAVFKNGTGEVIRSLGDSEECFMCEVYWLCNNVSEPTCF